MRGTIPRSVVLSEEDELLLKNLFWVKIRKRFFPFAYAQGQNDSPLCHRPEAKPFL